MIIDSEAEPHHATNATAVTIAGRGVLGKPLRAHWLPYPKAPAVRGLKTQLYWGRLSALMINIQTDMISEVLLFVTTHNENSTLTNNVTNMQQIKRAMGLEPTTICMGSKHSTTELHPRSIG